MQVETLLRFRAHLPLTFILNILQPCYFQTFRSTAALVGNTERDESGCEGCSWEHHVEHHVEHVPAGFWWERGERDGEPSPWGHGSWLKPADPDS